MTGDPANTYVVWIKDLDAVPLWDTRGQLVLGRVKSIDHGSKAAIVRTEQNGIPADTKRETAP